MVAEKRILQERCDKLMKNFDETEEKYKEQIKNLQQKHLDEIKRVRKAQITAESVKKQQWMGSKTQEIRVCPNSNYIWAHVYIFVVTYYNTSTFKLC